MILDAGFRILDPGCRLERNGLVRLRRKSRFIGDTGHLIGILANNIPLRFENLVDQGQVASSIKHSAYPRPACPDLAGPRLPVPGR